MEGVGEFLDAEGGCLGGATEGAVVGEGEGVAEDEDVLVGGGEGGRWGCEWVLEAGCEVDWGEIGERFVDR